MDETLIIHPGEVLMEEFLRPHNLTPSGFAATLGLPPNRITSLVNGQRGITAETALLLGAAFGTSAEFWMNLQRQHDLERTTVPADRMERAEAFHRTLAAA